jgi:hypothetical protein
MDIKITITLNYNAKNKIAVKTIKYILSLGVFKREHTQATTTFDRY